MLGLWTLERRKRVFLLLGPVLGRPHLIKMLMTAIKPVSLACFKTYLFTAQSP